MKTTLRIPLALTLALTLVCGGLAGCNTSQQQIAFNSLYTVGHATTTAYDQFIMGAFDGTFPTNDVPKVVHAYRVFTPAFDAALDAAQMNTNAIAPANVVLLSQDVLSVITAAKGKK